ncbi:MAG TPA: 40S ribosomal protein S19 [Candidatus Norongarragalinales archaeon]|nr:40S ribosomal protein S19 [Candidatus Norongarragalinales archaeon]
MGVMDADPQKVVEKAALELKKIGEIKPPEWAGLVKTSSHLERVPAQMQEFWFNRCASVLYQVFKHGPVGTERLRNKYGGRTQHIVHRSHHRKAGGKTIRLVLQQLEKAGLVKKEKTGRFITAKGKSLLDKSSKQG